MNHNTGVRFIRSPKNGFTLVEVIAVLLILGVIAAIASSSMDNSDEETAADVNSLKAALRYSQELAFAQTGMTNNTVVTWGVAVNSSGYTLRMNGGAQTLVNLPGTGSPSYTFNSNTSVTGPGEIFFNFRGIPVTGGAGSSAAVTADQTYTISNGNSSSTVTITQQTGYIP